MNSIKSLSAKFYPNDIESYINVSRIFLEKEKIQLLQDGFPVEGQQIVLAMSLIDPQEDNIKASDEIQNICNYNF
ncbi:TPA: hypothetical protein ACGPAW_001956 [Streptococcus suis]